MTGSSFVRIREIFNQLIELEPAQRREHLAGLEGVDEDTRRQLLDLLAADEKLDGATARSAVRRRPDEAAQWTGRRIGPFEIRAEIGRGGMATVFLAERVDGGVAQQVAIKIIRPDLVDAATLARFRLERQLLALLQHPNIPTLLDLGELDDRSPYVVMEYVTGLPIDRYVQEQALDLQQCLRLFLPVCDAVAFAHRNLIVHRDLKPGNVLVGAEGNPQLLDFGIAKPLQAQVGVIDVEETSAAQRFLSLSHAAPEQISGAPVTTACDVYGLGALLYELLTGAPPFVREGMTRGQLEQEILHRDAPPPGRAARAGWRIPYDLDLIVLRCLRKPPADRYASVDQLAEDIRRLLENRPVQARRGNVVYRAQRFIARHRFAMAASLLAAALLVTGATLLWRQQLATARQQARADEMTGLIMDALATVDANSASGRDMSARDMFQRVAAQARTRPQLSAESRARVLAAVANIELGLGYPADAEKTLTELPAGALDTASQSELDLTTARIYLTASRFDEARALIERKLSALADADTRADWQLLDANLASREGKAELALQKLDALDTQAFSNTQKERYGAERVEVLRVLGRFKDAAQAAYAVVESQRARLGQDTPAPSRMLSLLAELEVRLGNLAQAEALVKQLFALAEKHFSRNSSMYADALRAAEKLESARGNWIKSIDYEKQILAIQIANYGDTSRFAAYGEFNLASHNTNAGDRQAAARHYEKAVDLAERLWRSDHPNLLLFRLAASSFHVEQDQCVQARPLTRKSMADLQANPDLKRFDGAVLLEAIDAYCACVESPDTATRDALAKSLAATQAAAEDVEVKRMLQVLVEKSAKLGVTPAS